MAKETQPVDFGDALEQVLLEASFEASKRANGCRCPNCQKEASRASELVSHFETMDGAGIDDASTAWQQSPTPGVGQSRYNKDLDYFKDYE